MFERKNQKKLQLQRLQDTVRYICTSENNARCINTIASHVYLDTRQEQEEAAKADFLLHNVFLNCTITNSAFSEKMSADHTNVLSSVHRQTRSMSR